MSNLKYENNSRYYKRIKTGNHEESLTPNIPNQEEILESHYNRRQMRSTGGNVIHKANLVH